MRQWLNAWKRPLMGWIGMAGLLIALFAGPGSIAVEPTEPPSTPLESAEPTSTDETSTPAPATAAVATPTGPENVSAGNEHMMLRFIALTLSLALICMAIPARVWSSFRTWWTP